MDGNNSIEVSFDSPLSYRNTNESYLLKIWNEFDTDILGHVFYRFENSAYLEYFNSMSFNIYKDWNIQHFAIYTGEDCIDVLSYENPKISIV